MATLKEVAAAAGVSPATASRILNQDITLSVQEATREKVLAAARDLCYMKQPKSAAKPEMTIGIVQWFSSAQEIEDTYYLSIRQGIENYCQSQKIPVIRAYKNDLNYLDTLKKADALICIGKFAEEEIATFREMTDKLLFVDMPVPDATVTTITLDFEQAVGEAMDYLTGLGHRKIGFLSGIEYVEEEEQIRFADRRKEYFVRYCQEHGVEFEPYLYENAFTVESGYRMMTDMIESGDLPTAIFAASDPIAFGAMRALHDLGLRVPEDVSILGFNDISLASFTTPPLTTMRAPSMEMGQYGAILVRHFSGLENQVPMRIQMPCSLQIRETCGTPRKVEGIIKEN